MTLARMLNLGEVTAARVPAEEQEALRDLSPARQRAAKELAHARQRINAVLLRHRLFHPEKSPWNREHLAWLRRQGLDRPATQLTLDADTELVAMLLAHLKRLESQITGQARTFKCAEVIAALMCFRGVDITTSDGLAVEFGDWTRFTGPSIEAQLGLVPSDDRAHGNSPELLTEIPQLARAKLADLPAPRS